MSEKNFDKKFSSSKFKIFIKRVVFSAHWQKPEMRRKYKSVQKILLMGRPKKYGTAAERVAAKRASDRRSSQKRAAGRYFRLVIPALAGYPADWTWQTPAIGELKSRVVDRIAAHERSRGLVEWCVAVQRHPGTGLPHLDMLLVYAKRVYNASNHYDYAFKHGDLTRYRTINAAILAYNRKQDPRPLGNLVVSRVLDRARVRTDLYEMMRAAMLQRPFKFDGVAWLRDRDLDVEAVRTNVFKTLRAIRLIQSDECNRRLRLKPGIREITADFIRERLTASEFETYQSWQGYQIIVDHLNQIPCWGGRRLHKTRNLLVVGRPDTGKTRLALEVEKHTAVYYKDVSNWFPAYTPDTYGLILWNEFGLRGLKYPKLLNFLEGTKMDLEYKGGSVLKTDNPLIYMTSNLRLSEHILSRFRTPELRAHAARNLSARVTEVVIPGHLDLFLLLKLIAPFQPSDAAAAAS